MNAPFSPLPRRGNVYNVHSSSRPFVDAVHGWAGDLDTVDVVNGDKARAIYARRALEVALHHSADLMVALGLPERVLAALEAGIDALDDLDVPDMDREPSPDDEDGGDAEQIDEDGDDLDHGELDLSDYEPWLGAPEGAQHYHAAPLDLEADDAIERPWWEPNGCGWNADGGRYA